MPKPVDTLAQLMAPSPNAVRLRRATVSAATSTAVTISLAGAALSAPFLSSYTPTVGDTVLVLQTNAGLLFVLGKPSS